MRAHSSPVLTAALLIGLAAGAVGAGTADSPGRDPIQERVSVGLINVPVFVEDNGGEPVTDLTAADFVVLEDGEPMKVKHFAWIGSPAAAATGLQRESPELHVILFVDSQNIQPAHRQQVLKQLTALVEQEISADIPLMLAASNPGVEVLKGFSSPRSILPYRLEELGKSAGGGLFDANASRLQRDQIARAVARIRGCVRDPRCDLRSMESATTSTVGEIRAYSSGVADQVRGTFEKFQHFVGSLGSFPGTKSVLYISDGFPMQPGRDLFDQLSETVSQAFNSSDPGGQRERSGAGDAGSYQNLQDIIQRSPMDFFSNDISQAVERATATANANEVRVYTLQASALTSASAAGADDQSALRLLSNATGGSFLQGGMQTEKMLRRILDDTAGYYSIAYSPPPSQDQAYHAIEVKVKKRRTRARYPHGYLTRSDHSRRIDQVLAALFHGYGENEAAIGLDLGPGGRNAEQEPVVQVKVRIPVRSMELEKRGENHAADLKLIVAVMNGAGKTTMLREFPVAVAIPSQHIEQAREQDYPINLTVPASQGVNRVAVGLWDASSAGPALTHGIFEWSE